MHELILCAQALVYLAVLIGLGLAVAAGLPRLLPQAPGLFGFATLGFGAALALAFLLTATGALGNWAGWGLIALAAAAAWLRRANFAAALRQHRFAKADLLPLLALGAVLLPSFWIAINPAVLWDAAVYHLALPRIYLETGSFAPVEMSVYSIWPHGPQLLYAFGLLFGGPPLAKLFHFASGLLVLAGLHHGLRRSGLGYWRFGAWLAIGLFVVHPLVLFELQTAYVDLAQAFLFLAAFLFMTGAAPKNDAAAESGHAAGYLLLAGIACGGVAVCKPTGLLFLPALLPALLPFLLEERRQGRGRQAVMLAATRLGAPILLLWLPWIWRSWQLTGNPAYPFFWKNFGGPDWNERIGQQFATWQRGIGMGREPLDYLLLPFRVLTQGDRGYDHFDGRLALVLIPFLLLSLWRAARPEPPALLRPALASAALYFALWAVSSQQMRFLIPMLPLLALAAGLAAADIAEQRGWSTRLAPALALLLPIAAFADDPALAAKGLQHAAIYRHPGFDNDPRSAAPPFREKLAALPENAKVLLLNWNQGYYVPRPFIADSFFEASQIAAWLDGAAKEELPARLKQRGVTHILLSRQARVRYPQPLLELLSDPRQMRPLWVDEEWVLLELQAAAPYP